MKRPRRSPDLVAALVLIFGLRYAINADTLTLTTYYPAPSGVYKRLVTTTETALARDTGGVGIGSAAEAGTLLAVRGRGLASLLSLRDAAGAPVLEVASDGRLGVGARPGPTAMTVAGGVKIGMATSCGAANAGTLRWSGRLEACNGSDFVPVGEAKAVSGTLAGNCYGGRPTWPAATCRSWGCGYYWSGGCEGVATCVAGWQPVNIGGTSWGSIYVYVCQKL